ncbi:hypothetical protein DFP72DRAFT_852259 [Ephemerocybe angulata]|uniref:Uncharacterized protein n=1 Tax=Ephemerocybe angulata TaxID=980116 RepID=A0A8H6HNF0_9AGAR|nr:hypothetical protein DFP72DRAFT_852259 [Tulosesus angulatus]
MDPKAVNTNVTIDDFDTVLVYADQGQWTTPDPSAKDFNGNDPKYLRGTYHLTEVAGAALSLNFTGPAIYLYGHTGPRFGSYEIQLDTQTIIQSAHGAEESTGPTLLYGAENLTYGNHQLTLKNLGAKGAEGNALLLDFIQYTFQAAPAGATIRNVTFEEDNPAFSFTGEWGHNTSPAFSGGGTTYTHGDGATATFKFTGSAVYVLGDIKNDHRVYGIKLDGSAEQFYNGTSGCGGAFGLTCEQQVPILKYFASNLDQSEHTVVITNYAGVNSSFFDLDSVVVTVPSVYEPRQLADSGSPFVSTSGTATTGTAGTPTGSQSSSGSGCSSLVAKARPPAGQYTTASLPDLMTEPRKRPCRP